MSSLAEIDTEIRSLHASALVARQSGDRTAALRALKRVKELQGSKKYLTVGNGVGNDGEPDQSLEVAEVEEWLQYETDEGAVYFYNRKSAQSVWEQPETGVIVKGEELPEFEQEEPTSESSAVDPPSAARRSSVSPESILSSIRRRSSAAISQIDPTALNMMAAAGSPSIEEDEDDNEADDDEADDDEADTAGTWERCRGVTFGDGTGADNDAQVFYRNSATGATSWDKPEGYEEDLAELREEAAAETWERAEDFKVEVGNLTPCLSSSNPLPALQRLCELSQSAGTEEQWIELIAGADESFHLPQLLFNIIAHGHDPAGVDYLPAFGYSLRNLVLFSKLHSGIWTTLAALEDILTPARLAIPAVASMQGEEGEEEAMVLFMIFQELFKNMHGVENSLDELKLATSDLVKGLAGVKNAAFEQCGQALVVLNARGDVREAAGGPLVITTVRGDAQMTSGFVEVVMNILNDNSYPNCDNANTLSCLKVFCDVFSDPDVANMMFTNDTNVLIEILVRELENSPEKSVLRSKYVEVLHLLILNSSWGEERYKRAEIAKVVDGMMQGGVELFGLESQEAVEDLLKDCCFLLEE